MTIDERAKAMCKEAWGVPSTKGIFANLCLRHLREHDVERGLTVQALTDVMTEYVAATYKQATEFRVFLSTDGSGCLDERIGDCGWATIAHWSTANESVAAIRAAIPKPKPTLLEAHP